MENDTVADKESTAQHFMQDEPSLTANDDGTSDALVPSDVLASQNQDSVDQTDPEVGSESDISGLNATTRENEKGDDFNLSIVEEDADMDMDVQDTEARESAPEQIVSEASPDGVDADSEAIADQEPTVVMISTELTDTDHKETDLPSNGKVPAENAVSDNNTGQATTEAQTTTTMPRTDPDFPMTLGAEGEDKSKPRASKLPNGTSSFVSAVPRFQTKVIPELKNLGPGSFNVNYVRQHERNYQNIFRQDRGKDAQPDALAAKRGPGYYSLDVSKHKQAQPWVLQVQYDLGRIISPLEPREEAQIRRNMYHMTRNLHSVIPTSASSCSSYSAPSSSGGGGGGYGSLGSLSVGKKASTPPLTITGDPNLIQGSPGPHRRPRRESEGRIVRIHSTVEDRSMLPERLFEEVKGEDAAEEQPVPSTPERPASMKSRERTPTPTQKLSLQHRFAKDFLLGA